MKFLSYYLSGTRLPPLQPSVLNHWYFSDPVYGTTFTYPSTTYCGALTTLSACNLPGDSCFTETVCGGYFFPWGYQITNVTVYDILGYKGQLKGDTTITFIPSALDITYYDVFKIAFNFGDGTDDKIIQRNIVSKLAFDSLDQFTAGYDLNSPIYTNVSHTFYASSVPVTYTPTLTVFYGDCTIIFFNLSFTILPNSIYEVDNVHLLNTIQLPRLANSSLNTFEIESISQVADIILTQQLPTLSS